MTSLLLEQLFDSGLPSETDVVVADWARMMVLRLGAALAMAEVAAAMPRRLGAASASELAADKKYARRVAYTLRARLHEWVIFAALTGYLDVLNFADQARVAGAQVQWNDWFLDWELQLKTLCRRIATWALSVGDERNGNVMVAKLQREQLELQRIFEVAGNNEK